MTLYVVVGFYGPLFEPVFTQVHRGRQLLTFETVEAVRQQGFADASFQATLNACARRLATPVIYLEAAIDHQKVVKEMIQDKLPRLFAFEPPPGDLRAVKVVANDAAHQEKFVIPTNMRVPESSVIHRLFSDAAGGNAADRDSTDNRDNEQRRNTTGVACVQLIGAIRVIRGQKRR